MKFTKSFILKAFEKTSETDEDDIQLDDRNTDNSRNSTTEELKKRYKKLMNKFFVSNNILDKYICLSFSIFCFLISLMISVNNNILDDYCLESSSNIKNSNNDINNNISKCTQLSYYNKHISYIKVIFFFNIIFNLSNIMISTINSKSKHELLSFSHLIYTRYWHLFRTSIVFGMKITFLLSYFLNFSYIVIYSNARKDIYANNLVVMALVFEIYFMYSLIRSVYFCFNIIFTVLIFPLFITAFFIARFEDRFNYGINKLIKTEIKGSKKNGNDEFNKNKKKRKDTTARNRDKFDKVDNNITNNNNLINNNSNSVLKEEENRKTNTNDDNLVNNNQAINISNISNMEEEKKERPSEPIRNNLNINNNSNNSLLEVKINFNKTNKANNCIDKNRISINSNNSINSNASSLSRKRKLENLKSDKTELIKNDADISRRSSLLLVCPICLSDILDGELISTLPCDNRHSFHTFCLENWFEKNSSCPICRFNFTSQFNNLMNNINLVNSNNTNLSIELREGLL